MAEWCWESGDGDHTQDVYDIIQINLLQNASAKFLTIFDFIKKIKKKVFNVLTIDVLRKYGAFKICHAWHNKF